MIFVGHPGKGSGQDKKISGIVFHNNYPIFDLKTLSAGGFQLKESYRTNLRNFYLLLHLPINFKLNKSTLKLVYYQYNLRMILK